MKKIVAAYHVSILFVTHADCAVVIADIIYYFVRPDIIIY